MDNFSCFLKSNDLQNLSYASFGRRPVIYSFDVVEAYFRQHDSHDRNFIFAKPVINQNCDKTRDTIAWYSNQHDNALCWDYLDEKTKSRLKKLRLEWQFLLHILNNKALLPIVERFLTLLILTKIYYWLLIASFLPIGDFCQYNKR